MTSSKPPTPDVTVVVPTRDRPDRLQLSMRCVLAQRDVELEVVVVDDGSTDERAASGASTDPRVVVLRNQQPLGESGARNRGIGAARGRWIAFLDDDDLWAPSKLSLQLDAIRATRRRWAYAGYVTIDTDLNVLSGTPPPRPEDVSVEISTHNAVPGSASSVIVASQVLADVGMFDTTLRRTPDWDLWLRLARIGLPASVERPVVAISEHTGNASRDMEALFVELPILAARYGIDVDVARHHRWAAWVASLDGRRADALRHYARAVAAGDIASVGRALVSLVRHPAPAAVPGSDAWADEARTWLDPLKAHLDPFRR